MTYKIAVSKSREREKEIKDGIRKEEGGRRTSQLIREGPNLQGIREFGFPSPPLRKDTWRIINQFPFSFILSFRNLNTGGKLEK